MPSPWQPVDKAGRHSTGDDIPAEPLRSALRIGRNTPGMPPDSRLVSRAPRPSRCSPCFIHGLPAPRPAPRGTHRGPGRRCRGAGSPGWRRPGCSRRPAGRESAARTRPRSSRAAPGGKAEGQVVRRPVRRRSREEAEGSGGGGQSVGLRGERAGDVGGPQSSTWRAAASAAGTSAKLDRSPQSRRRAPGCRSSV